MGDALTFVKKSSPHRRLTAQRRLDQEEKKTQRRTNTQQEHKAHGSSEPCPGSGTGPGIVPGTNPGADTGTVTTSATTQVAQGASKQRSDGRFKHVRGREHGQGESGVVQVEGGGSGGGGSRHPQSRENSSKRRGQPGGGDGGGQGTAPPRRQSGSGRIGGKTGAAGPGTGPSGSVRSVSAEQSKQAEEHSQEQQTSSEIANERANHGEDQAGSHLVIYFGSVFYGVMLCPTMLLGLSCFVVGTKGMPSFLSRQPCSENVSRCHAQRCTVC